MEAFQRKGGFLIYALIGVNVLLVLGAGPVVYFVDAWWAYGLAFVLVGARGQSLYILQHEAMHNLIAPGKRTNEIIGVLLSAMLGTQFYTGRKMHMLHHRFTGMEDDPNIVFHGTDDKRPGREALLFFVKNLFGWRLIGLVKSVAIAVLSHVGLIKTPKPAHAMLRVKESEARIDLIALFVVQLTIFAAMSIFTHPLVYIGLYLLPLSTLTCFFEALRSFSEHVLPTGAASHEAETKRAYFMNAGPIERFFISQFGFHYHHVHHQHTNVPTLNVKRLHEWKLANDPAFKDSYIERPGYVMTAIRYVLGLPIPGQGAVHQG